MGGVRRLLLTLALAALLCLGAAAAQPYAIEVNRAANTVTVYRQDSQGAYTIPVRAMICSTARSPYFTPLGTYSVTGQKHAWLCMIDGSYGQYATQFYGNYLFHSVCYTKPDPAALMTEEYNLLGSPASRGCVRLQTADAKWIYDNCGAGTRVTVCEAASPGPLGKPEKLVPEITPALDNGWDPTDPRSDNPWLSRLIAAVALEQTAVTLTAGEGRALAAAETPCAVSWSSSDPAVVSVDQTGRAAARQAGTAVITAVCGSASSRCTVTVRGTLLPFADLTPGAWYYGDVRYACEAGCLAGTEPDRFSPDAPLSWAMAVQLVQRLSGAEAEPAGPGEAWYAPAYRWASKTRLLRGWPARVPSAPIARQELVWLLYRSGIIRRGGEFPVASLSGYTDLDQIAPAARTAMGWAVDRGILQGGEDGRLSPWGQTTRAQAAAILRRCDAAARIG